MLYSDLINSNHSTLEDVIRRMMESNTHITVASSTRISQPWAAHDIVCPIPSSMILVVRYSVQHSAQNLWPHSSPAIVCKQSIQKTHLFNDKPWLWKKQIIQHIRNTGLGFWPRPLSRYWHRIAFIMRQGLNTYIQWKEVQWWKSKKQQYKQDYQQNSFHRKKNLKILQEKFYL